MIFDGHVQLFGVLRGRSHRLRQAYWLFAAQLKEIHSNTAYFFAKKTVKLN